MSFTTFGNGTIPKYNPEKVMFVIQAIPPYNDITLLLGALISALIIFATG